MEVEPQENLIDSYLDDELDTAEAEALRKWLHSDRKNLVGFFGRVFLHWQLREKMLSANLERSLKQPGESFGDAEVMRDSAFRRSWGPLSQSAVILVSAVVGVMAGSYATYRWMHDRDMDDRIIVASSPLPLPDGARVDEPVVATLVNATNCTWDTARSTANLKMGSLLRPGEALHLLEGVAQIRSVVAGTDTVVQLEGPAALTLTREGIPNLLYGKLSAEFSADYDQFALDTPLGRIVVSGNASIGVICNPSDVELHVFSGTATLELWAAVLRDFGSLTAESGSSLRAYVAEDGEVAIDHGESHERWFVNPASLAKSRLVISEEYVKSIVDSQPLAYWRFEYVDAGQMRNEVADRLHCRLTGDAVRWRNDGANGSAEFGVTEGPGYLLSDDVIDLNDDSYTLEAWVKPAHHHHGALFSLIDWAPSRSPFGSHRLHLELCGPVSGFADASRTTEFNPGRVRFIHQNSEWFSSAPYEVRTWQHIAAVKDGANVRLYTNGELVASGEDARSLGSGLHVLMGQLFPRSPYLQDEVTSRLFVGELDEVALYSHPLTADELRRHVQLVLPSSLPADE